MGEVCEGLRIHILTEFKDLEDLELKVENYHFICEVWIILAPLDFFNG